jgi:uncharacterized repeat protein (TIGR01451 family)
MSRVCDGSGLFQARVVREEDETMFRVNEPFGPISGAKRGGVRAYMLAFWLAAQTTVSGNLSILIDETFDDGDRTNQNLPESVRWFGSRTPQPEVVDGKLVSNSTQTPRGVLGYLDSPVSVPLGWFLDLSFDYSFSASSANDWTFIFGLYDSNGEPMTSDITTGFNNSIFFGHTGYVVSGIRGDGGFSKRYKISRRRGENNNLYNVSPMLPPIPDSTDGPTWQTGGMESNTTYSASLNLYHASVNEMIITAIIDGQSLIRTDTVASVVSTFDQVGIVTGGDGALTIDNVQLITYPYTNEVDLGVSMSASTNYALAGSNIAYTIVVSNNSLMAASLYYVTSSLSSTLEYMPDQDGVGGLSINGRNATWRLAGLAAGGTTSITINATAAYTGSTQEVSGVVSVGVMPAYGDPELDNNETSSSAVTVVGIPMLTHLGMLLLAIAIGIALWRKHERDMRAAA